MIEVADGTKNNPDPNFSENRKLAMSLVNHCKKPNPGDFLETILVLKTVIL